MKGSKPGGPHSNVWRGPEADRATRGPGRAPSRSVEARVFVGCREGVALRRENEWAAPEAEG